MKRWVPYTMLIIGLIGALVTFPLWLTNRISDRAMLGITLILSWAALWYEGWNAIQIHKQGEDK